MDLKNILRKLDDDNNFKALQTKTRFDLLNNDDVVKLYEYHIDNPQSFTPDQRCQIEKGAMFVLARKDDRNEHNRKMLEKTATEQNPVAVIKADSYSYLPGYTLAMKSHFLNYYGITEYTLIC